MRYRTQLYALIGLLAIALGGIWLLYSLKDQENVTVIDATVNRDCAPWDGSAFTVSVPEPLEASIDISIWQSPDMKLPATFSFPDQTGSVGNAIYRPVVGSPEQLTGTVFFQRIAESNPVEGTFNFTTESGKQFKGRFKAIWGNTRALCG
jgi:hypothetical protein